MVEHNVYNSCPITNESVPNKFIWTDHERKGLFNSCGACNPKTTSLDKMLAKLKKKRLKGKETT